MVIYLDIDGTLIHEDGNRHGQSAHGLERFLSALEPHDPFWLTTHCRDGNPKNAQRLLKSVVSEKCHTLIDRIKPTSWDTQKIEAIDWTQDFLWLDNDINQSEHIHFHRRLPGQQVIEMDLVANPEQLAGIADDLIILNNRTS